MKTVLFVILSLFVHSASADSDKVDIDGLEKNYWKTKDTDYNVIQNRNFKKTDRMAIGTSVGSAINDPNSSGGSWNISTHYFLDETWSLEAGYTKYDLVDNENTVFFRERFGVTPDHNKLSSLLSIGANWSPIYAKLNLFGKKIIYFDMSFGLSLGTIQYQQQKVEGAALQSSPHLSFKISQLFFFSKNMGIRIAYDNYFSQQERLKYKQPTNGSDRSLGKSSINDSSMSIGLVFFN